MKRQNNLLDIFENNEFFRRNASILVLLLLIDQRFSLLPELYRVFGAKKLLLFLEIFSGMTFNVISRKKLLELYRDVHIYTAISNAGPSKRNVINDLARQYSLDSDVVRKIYKRVAECVQKDFATLAKIKKEIEIW